MPRAKDTTPADAMPEIENGFAALEAKVEEMQVEAAIEAELNAEDAAAAASTIALEEIPQARLVAPEPEAPAAAETPTAAPAAEALAAPGPTAAVQAMLAALQDCAQSTYRFQADSLASFAQVRGPHDLLAAQVAYSQRAVSLCRENLARTMQALPVFATR
ncbi:hypothetical protein [Phenylobacterium sp.]|jgi:hypothetical protein|uniref:hypothetical protein n=1 Tax=Phenylobacterium sp. TaxID=1871053 RepID=UPI002F93D7C3